MGIYYKYLDTYKQATFYLRTCAWLCIRIILVFENSVFYA